MQTRIVDNGRVSLDPTCSLPIETILVDAQDRGFDRTDGLLSALVMTSVIAIPVAIVVALPTPLLGAPRCWSAGPPCACR